MSIMGLQPPRRKQIPLNTYRVSAPGIARVVSNERLTPLDHDDVRHIVLDLDGLDYSYLEGQSLGILAPGTDGLGRPHKLRLYSIASTRLGDDGLGRTASLCVKRVVYYDPVAGREQHGITSNYLCDLAPGDAVAVTGPVGKTFLLPEDPTSNLILVATGTGIAPFRAFLRRIYLERPGQSPNPRAVHHFFGVRTAAEFLYRDEFEALGNQPGLRLTTAFSREQSTTDGQRMYVQHRMAEQIGALWDLLRHDDTYLFICGLKGMEDGIDAVLEAHAEAEGVPWIPFRTALRECGRLVIETY
jgi:ferredoxin--NADP+ reductase